MIEAPKMQLTPTIESWLNQLFPKISTFIISMYLIFLEALAAGLILIGIVWWTMFTGRPKPQQNDQEQEKIQQEN
jgi:plastocyanin domain-containing protein